MKQIPAKFFNDLRHLLILGDALQDARHHFFWKNKELCRDNQEHLHDL